MGESAGDSQAFHWKIFFIAILFIAHLGSIKKLLRGKRKYFLILILPVLKYQQTVEKIVIRF
jgi:hypothetical protein